MTTQRERDAETRRAARPREWARQIVMAAGVALLALCVWISCALVTAVMGGGR